MNVAVALRTGRRPGRVARAARIAIGLVYLFGSPTHVYFALFAPDGYRGMGEWSPPYIEASRAFWESWFLPNARIFGLLVAAAELTIAVLILSRARATQRGLLAATGFHVVLALLFGMWPYTIPMIVGLAYLSTLDFDALVEPRS